MGSASGPSLATQAETQAGIFNSPVHGDSEVSATAAGVNTPAEALNGVFQVGVQAKDSSSLANPSIDTIAKALPQLRWIMTRPKWTLRCRVPALRPKANR